MDTLLLEDIVISFPRHEHIQAELHVIMQKAVNVHNDAEMLLSPPPAFLGSILPR